MWPGFDALGGLSFFFFDSALRGFLLDTVLRFSPLTKSQRLILFVMIQFDLYSPRLVKQLCSAKSSDPPFLVLEHIHNRAINIFISHDLLLSDLVAQSVEQR